MNHPDRRRKVSLCAAVLPLILTACSKPAPPPAAQRSLSGDATQALVVAQAHLAGEAPRYGNVSWERQPDSDGLAVFVLKPEAGTPTVTAKVGASLVELKEVGALSHVALAGLASAAGAPPGQHGPTADKIEGLLAIANETGQAASDVTGKVTYVAAPTGDAVTARLAS